MLRFYPLKFTLLVKRQCRLRDVHSAGADGVMFGMGVTCLACWRSSLCNQTGHPSFSSSRHSHEVIAALHGQAGLKRPQVMSLLGMMSQIVLPERFSSVYIHIQGPAVEVGIPVPGCSIPEAARRRLGLLVRAPRGPRCLCALSDCSVQAAHAEGSVS